MDETFSTGNTFFPLYRLSTRSRRQLPLRASAAVPPSHTSRQAALDYGGYCGCSGFLRPLGSTWPSEDTLLTCHQARTGPEESRHCAYPHCDIINVDFGTCSAVPRRAEREEEGGRVGGRNRFSSIIPYPPTPSTQSTEFNWGEPVQLDQGGQIACQPPSCQRGVCTTWGATGLAIAPGLDALHDLKRGDCSGGGSL